MRPSLELGLDRVRNPRQLFDVNFDAVLGRTPAPVRDTTDRSLADASSRSFALAIETHAGLELTVP